MMIWSLEITANKGRFFGVVHFVCDNTLTYSLYSNLLEKIMDSSNVNRKQKPTSQIIFHLKFSRKFKWIILNKTNFDVLKLKGIDGKLSSQSLWAQLEWLETRYYTYQRGCFFEIKGEILTQQERIWSKWGSAEVNIIWKSREISIEREN